MHESNLNFRTTFILCWIFIEIQFGFPVVRKRSTKLAKGWERARKDAILEDKALNPFDQNFKLRSKWSTSAPSMAVQIVLIARGTEVFSESPR